VQILARPVTGRRVVKARRSARRVHAGGSTRLVGLLLDLITPGMKTGPARQTTTSAALHSDAPGQAAKPIGVTDTGHERPVALGVPDARHHLHVIGATGSGKSTLLGTMILADAEAGRGIVLIDPKGDLVTDILSRLPKSAADRVVLFDADSKSQPPCLNPLDGGETDLTVDNLVSVFRRVYSAFWGRGPTT
jgi:type IV secretory pathway TraG/TraD family ATPase VirD4